MKLGFIQQKIVELGKRKGYVTSNDIRVYYSPENMKRKMNLLVMRGYFNQPEDCGTYIKWKIKQDKKDKNKKLF